MLRGLLVAEGCKIGRRHVKTLMRRMGLEALYRRPRTTKPEPGHKIYPYLLRGVEITRPNQVWAMDITYIPMARGFVYLAVVHHASSFIEDFLDQKLNMGTPHRLGKAKFKSRVHAVQRTDKHGCGNAPNNVNQSATKSALRSRCPAKMSPRFRLWSPGCNDTTQPGFFFIPPTARALGNPAIDSRTPLRLNVLAKTGVGTRPRISALTDLPPIGSSGGGFSFMNASPGRAS